MHKHIAMCARAVVWPIVAVVCVVAPHAAAGLLVSATAALMAIPPYYPVRSSGESDLQCEELLPYDAAPLANCDEAERASILPLKHLAATGMAGYSATVPGLGTRFCVRAAAPALVSPIRRWRYVCSTTTARRRARCRTAWLRAI